jgi:hypothetical protein
MFYEVRPMVSTGSGRRLVFGCTLAALLGATGCDAQDDGVASLSGSEQGQDSRLSVAEQYLDCLGEAGIPAVLMDSDKGPWVDFDSEQVTRSLVRDADGFALDRGFPPETEYSPVELEFLRTWDGGYALMLDGVDYTDAYTACRNTVPYTNPWSNTAPADELLDKQAMAKASNEWAACARENGWPGLADVLPGEADNYQTTPTVLLPQTMTGDELRQLLAACPAFGTFTANSRGTEFEAGIDFDYDPDAAEPEPPPTVDPGIHVQELRDILYEQQPWGTE